MSETRSTVPTYRERERGPPQRPWQNPIQHQSPTRAATRNTMLNTRLTKIALSTASWTHRLLTPISAIHPPSHTCTHVSQRLSRRPRLGERDPLLINPAPPLARPLAYPRISIHSLLQHASPRLWIEYEASNDVGRIGNPMRP